MSNAETTAYKVGYKKPPLHSRWPKGKSGNAAGRKKGKRTLDQEVQDALNARVPVTQNGQKSTMTKLQAALTQVFNKAAAGDPKSAKLLFDLARQADQAEALKSVLDTAAAQTPSPVRIFELPNNDR
jgi:hypothetical protein